MGDPRVTPSPYYRRTGIAELDRANMPVLRDARGRFRPGTVGGPGRKRIRANNDAMLKAILKGADVMTRRMVLEFLFNAQQRGLLPRKHAQRLRQAVRHGEIALDLNWIRPTRMPWPNELARGFKRRAGDMPPGGE